MDVQHQAGDRSTGSAPGVRAGQGAQPLVEVDAWDWKENRAVTLDAAACRLGHRAGVFKHTARWSLLMIGSGLHPSSKPRRASYGWVPGAT